MTTVQAAEPKATKQLRLRPGVIVAVLLVVVWFGLPLVVPEGKVFGVLAGIAGGLIILLWWMFFSRVPWIERWGAVVLAIGGLFAASQLVHESIRTGMMGMMLTIYSLPVLGLALVSWAVACGRMAPGPRRVSLLAAIVLAYGIWTLLRTDGVTGDGAAELAWRWTRTAEERLLSQAGDEAARPSPSPLAEKPVVEWPGFRGAERDGIVRGVRVDTNWSQSPPVELWRRPIGPGWSSFAVREDLFYTQEQRGEEEAVACYKLATGEPVWRHSDPARFWESNGGAGPRGTPTLSKSRVYTFGATGILNALDAGNGSVIWSRNVASETDVKVPGWGFSSSPLVVDDVVIVAASGRLAAFDAVTGNPRWLDQSGGGSYSSPHRLTLGGVVQVLLVNAAGVRSVAPADGALLWEHPWKGVPICQPALTADGDVLISTGGASGGLGLRRLGIAHGSMGWTVQQRWASTGLKPYFNDLVLHKNHAFGFDGSILACIGLEDGRRKWKGGRYGHGQLLLLPDQDLLLVVSEKGELALVGATAEQFTEVTRSPAIEGKTWNHPALAGEVLLVRNGEEMAAFRLPTGKR